MPNNPPDNLDELLKAEQEEEELSPSIQLQIDKVKNDLHIKAFKQKYIHGKQFNYLELID